MAPRTHTVRRGLLCLVPADTCRLLVVTVTVLCPAAMGLLLPFGTSQGDARSQSDSISSPAVSLSTPFVFFGNQYSTLRAINDGFVSFTANKADIFNVESDFTDVVIAAVCVFCSDIVPGTSGSVCNRLTTDTVALQTIQNVTREYQEFGSTFTPSWAFVVTWDSVLTYQYTGPGNTMQAILASNGSTSLVILQYDIISWVDDNSIGNNVINTKVGFNKGDRTQFYLFPESKTAALFNLTVTSNTGSPGLFLFRVDVTAISPTLTKTTTTVPTTAATTTTAAAATTSVATTAAETTTTGVITVPTTTTFPTTADPTTTVRTTAVPNSAVQTTAYTKVAPFLSCVTIILLCYTGTIPVSKGRPSA